jgi:hypothetical protein
MRRTSSERFDLASLWLRRYDANGRDEFRGRRASNVFNDERRRPCQFKPLAWSRFEVRWGRSPCYRCMEGDSLSNGAFGRQLAGRSFDAGGAQEQRSHGPGIVGVQRTGQQCSECTPQSGSGLAAMLQRFCVLFMCSSESDLSRI